MSLINAADNVIEDIKQALAAQGIKETSLRIHMNIGWGGASYYLVLDEPGDLDQVQVINGIQFIVSQSLIDTNQGFTLESVKHGDLTMFRIIPWVEEAGGGCSSCTSCG